MAATKQQVCEGCELGGSGRQTSHLFAATPITPPLYPLARRMWGIDRPSSAPPSLGSVIGSIVVAAEPET